MEEKFKNAIYYDEQGNGYKYEDVYFSQGYFYTKDKNKFIVRVRFRVEDL